jgi:transposase-like protein
VEADEVYVVAGHKGQPKKVVQAGRAPRNRRLKGHRGRGTSSTEKPPILGLVQRDGPLVLYVLDNVKQATIRPIIEKHVETGTLMYTDEYNIYDRLPEWGFAHKTVCHSAGEYARDEDGDGFHEVHVNTQEGIWSVLRSWLRPHRGVSMDKLPAYLGFFEFVFNTKRRGKALIQNLFETILAMDIRKIEDLALSPAL